jgi:hypothetical protein
MNMHRQKMGGKSCTVAVRVGEQAGKFDFFKQTNACLISENMLYRVENHLRDLLLLYTLFFSVHTTIRKPCHGSTRAYDTLVPHGRWPSSGYAGWVVEY